MKSSTIVLVVVGLVFDYYGTTESAELDANYGALLQRFATLEARVGEIDDIKAKMVAMETEFAQKMVEMNFEIMQLKSGISNQESKGQRRGVSRTPIAFYSIVSAHYVDTIGAYQRVVFDSVYTNLGNAYHNQSGLFIAPLAGTYVFSVTLSGRVVDATTSYFTINVNSDVRGKLGSHTSQQDTNTLVLVLRAGDRVYVANADGHNGVLGTHYSTFSGYLLYEI